MAKPQESPPREAGPKPEPKQDQPRPAPAPSEQRPPAPQRPSRKRSQFQ